MREREALFSDFVADVRRKEKEERSNQKEKVGSLGRWRGMEHVVLVTSDEIGAMCSQVGVRTSSQLAKLMVVKQILVRGSVLSKTEGLTMMQSVWHKTQHDTIHPFMYPGHVHDDAGGEFCVHVNSIMSIVWDN